MLTHFSDIPLTYDGAQLRAHFAFDTFGVLGDSIVAFTGACNVKTCALVDLEDARRNLFIRSENMLHFIAEHFRFDLHHTIALQRLLVALIIEEIHDALPEVRLTRKGNDIFEDNLKLSVSIATRSPVSTLIHTGVNISANLAPVPAKGLGDYGLSAPAVAHGVMHRYREEIAGIERSAAKVRGVG